MLKSFYDAEIEEIFESLKTSKKGLNSKEADERLKKYGRNVLPRKKKDGLIKIFFREFLDPLVLLLFVAIIASLVAGEIIDAFVILGIILVDVILGVYQENRANKTAEALEKLIRVNTNTLRNNSVLPLDAELLVPGDIVMLESGDKIPADLRLIEVHNFSVDESILTGESLAVVKDPAVLEENIESLSDRINLAYSGTTVVSGRATAVVIKTGLETELGKIADSFNNAVDEKTPLSLRVNKLSKQITIMVLVVAIVTAALLIYKRVPYTEILITVIAFAVSAMPEGLPLALTMALTIASNRMAKQNVIVRKLKAAESLGSCTVIASDKTGTLTMNQQTAKKIVLPNGKHYEVTGSGYDLNGEVKGESMKY
ncbi:MAG: HAD-IC family P-type ATPase, partial [Candidatus Saccharibacteria bacterium]|nr:HAD-IC family P-type ATPase [Candidatus Saccharibacteria bacterium]